MSKWCSHCVDRGGWFSTSYYCNVSGTEESIPSSYIDNFCKNDGYKCPRYESQYGSSSGCFITTVTCGVLGKDDHDPVMDGLRKFRDEVLQKNEEYSDVLKLYDKVGPLLATKISLDKDRDEKASMLYSKLERFVEIINNGDYKTAANNYIIMTLKLVSQYGMQEGYRYSRDHNFGYEDGEFDQKTAGHGKTSKKITKTLD